MIFDFGRWHHESIPAGFLSCGLFSENFGTELRPQPWLGCGLVGVQVQDKVSAEGDRFSGL